MKTTTVMFTLFLAAFGLCMTASALPHGEPVGLRVYKDSIYVDDKSHSGHKLPFRHGEPPHVEYDSEANILSVETASDQTVTYYIKDGAGTVVQKGELLLRTGQETIVYLYITPADDIHNIYIRSNGIVYVGEL